MQFRRNHKETNGASRAGQKNDARRQAEEDLPELNTPKPKKTGSFTKKSKEKAQNQPKNDKTNKANKEANTDGQKNNRNNRNDRHRNGNRPGTNQAKKGTQPTKKALPNGKIKVIPLGGLGEIGKNLTVVEYENDLVIIDCGLGFPDDDMPGIDLVIPDFTYLEENKDRIRGLLITHGHEDHIGGIPYLLKVLNIPVYGTALTIGVLKNKLEEFTLAFQPQLNVVKAGDRIPCGEMTAEFIHVNHSIADACAIALHTPIGTVLHTGDFKLDTTPIDGEMIDLCRFGELGKEGVLLLLCESTNAERPGYTPSEKKVGASMETIFASHEKKRIVVATFSSNVHRVQQLIDISARHKRKVAITGRSMINIVRAATELGYMKIPQSVLIDIASIGKYKPEELTIVTTGSQGEPMSALYRMAFADHSQVTLTQNDLVILSASAIPGNEKTVGNIINELSRMNIEVIHDVSIGVHVSGHACQEELKLMLALTKPKYFMPVHGEIRHLKANHDLAVAVGIPETNIFLSEIGKVLEITRLGAKWNGEVTAGKTFVDGYGVGDVGSMVLRDRKHLSQDGLIIVVATIEPHEGMLLSGPDIISRGFVYVKEAENMMDEIKQVAEKAITSNLRKGRIVDRSAIRKRIRDDVDGFVYKTTGRKPMILTVLMDI